MSVPFLYAASCPSAHAQSAKLNPVDQGFADVGPLSASSRVVPLDLRVPSGFDRVYRLGSSRPGGERFARMSGGVTAVFPRSQYVPTADGYASTTPAGTVFYIGRLPNSLTESADSSLVARGLNRPNYDDRSARAAVLDRPRTIARSGPVPTPVQADRGAAIPPSAAPRASEPTIFNDEEYRARRVAQLLDIASQAAR
jgi:hypothetical protein